MTMGRQLYYFRFGNGEDKKRNLYHDAQEGVKQRVESESTCILSRRIDLYAQ